MKKEVFYLIFLVFFFSCRDGTLAMDKGFSLMVYNYSSNDIYAYLADGGQHTAYPDTLLSAAFPGIGNSSVPLIPKGLSWPFRSNQNWKDRVLSLPRDTLSIFILSPDTLSKYSWDVIRVKNKILKRYDLSVADLEKTGYNVYYP